ncbi:MAG: cyanoexosortase B system-associated protein [Elainellaceae cyanobacterium]
MPLPLMPSEGHSSEQDASVQNSHENSHAQISQGSEGRAGGDRPTQRLRLLIAVIVLAIATFSILPNYFTGNWLWNTPPVLAQASQLNRLRAEGLALPGWQTLEQQTVSISGSKWSIQAIQPEANVADPEGLDSQGSDAASSTRFSPSSQPNRPILVMLRPQVWHREQPQVEWMDINGAQQWTVDHRQRIFLNTEGAESSSSDSELLNSESLNLELSNSKPLNSGLLDLGDRSVSFTARYFRGWSRQQTSAVVQWYAWTTGGSPSINPWFWADQWQQLRDRQRMPWVAVTVLIPIKPLGNIDTARTTAKSLSQTLQAQLIRDVLTNPT